MPTKPRRTRVAKQPRCIHCRGAIVLLPDPDSATPIAACLLCGRPVDGGPRLPTPAERISTNRRYQAHRETLPRTGYHRKNGPDRG